MDDNGELKKLLEENLEVAKENNRLLRIMRRDAYIALAVKVVLYLVIFGVPLYLLSQYLGPLVESFSAATSSAPSSGPLFIPSEEQIQQVRELYGI